ncbi:pyridoxal phosphate-dependent aminotransferase family protein [Herbivorax sp. ANBcel31]|uniref:aminotransferase class I/II-fold pyridoxal phosphate-dependent enzyme n=1 Tax=Herbivorax sp. ANBcel31 TaxID=3069754 RepID=UPI0027AFD103|nr:pyridoxal phosphate-dependent aminotransferase family protein [Herbivorax sp. ANBcel31]MDQ2087525.1 pyridoxal phosphate-dependent aminotransferase family protein [Herbivorax sp. ANBcel31]
MRLDSFYNRLKVDKQVIEKAEFNPYYNCIESGLDNLLIIDGEEYVNLAANNYLGLGADKRLKRAAINAVEKYGVSLCGTPVATGYIELYKRVERKISKFLSLEDTVIFPSCYQANNGLFATIAGKEDLILVDHYAHSSLIEGIKSVGCKIRPFLHNNPEHLEKILKNSSKYRQVFIVTESVFSTEGSIAPLKEIYELGIKYGAVTVVDDSHGIGVIGKNGKGVLEECGIENFKGIYTASLGKAIAASGGVISGSREIIEYLRYFCPQLVYSTGISPALLGAVEKVLDIIETEFDKLGKKLWDYRDTIRNRLILNGFDLCDGKAPIISIKTGDALKTVLFAKSFYNKKILTTPFVEPSVPPNEGRLRLIAGANLSKKSIEKACEKIDEIGREI